jgi:apolipoprotein N-acyltransferase
MRATSTLLLRSLPFLVMSQRFPLRSLLTVFASGILMGLAPAPANLWILAWIALVPLWVLVVEQGRWVPLQQPQSSASPFPLSRSLVRLKAPILYGWVWGIGYHGLALSWIRGLHPLTWMGVPWLASIAITCFCWAFITLWGAAIAALWVSLFRRLCCPGRSYSRDYSKEDVAYAIPGLQRLGAAINSLPIPHPLLRVLMGTVLWWGIEWIWSQSVLYWTSLSYTQSPHNLLILHLGQISGPLTVTGAIVAVNGLLAEAWIAFVLHKSPIKAKRLLGIACVCFIGCHAMGWVLYRQPLLATPESSLKVGIVQGNIPTRIKLFDEGQQLALDRYTQGYEQLAAAGVDAVLTPEGAFPWLWLGRANQANNSFYQAVLEQGVTAWIGTVGLRQDRVTQTLFTLTGSGQILSRYDKVKLVPLGEYIPFESILGEFVGRLSPVDASMLPGRTDQVFETPFGRAIVAICYESAFPQLFRWQALQGGQFILTASNNDPYNAAMMMQHHAQDVMRAIETSRWAVRATNTGFSGIVDPHGRTEWLSQFRAYEVHAHTIDRRQNQTLYVQWGDWLLPTLAALALTSLVRQGLQQRRLTE